MGVFKTKRPLLTPSKALVGGAGSVRLVEYAFTLTTANITGMNGTPVTVIPAPASNLALVIDVIMFQMKPGATQFTGGGAVTFVYHGGSVNPHAGNVPAATVTSASASETQLPPPSAAIVIPPGTGLDITNATAAFATGNGSAVVKIFAHLVVQD